MQDDFDLEGLTPAEARRYVAGFIQSLQLARKSRAEREVEYEKWKSRTKLAADRGDMALAKEALARAEDLHASLSALRREERELDFKVTELKRRLKNVQRAPQFTVNAEALLEQLQSVTDPDQATREAISEAEAELKLEELRRKMEQDKGGADGPA